ncbi:ribosomal RNA small subunit methyltransferase A [Holospora obtusa F1]|uniref:Ribosomal RNA small subunit methyltransferase A n=1 Tax=Holospora obtusa F1 TaxID=1399147 RepID=W6TDX0_HOLOB|nr:16S rRNA (adenine(1518)-N(6)/adenine(1519)-N(6))-dimethyltransferase RsmA [Holospora obtusa]ETZ07298.1 ribosomal RNA small subunit methyltransferase A [Holospora obtusa F1]
MSLKASKRLGQHFLKNHLVLAQIANAIEKVQNKNRFRSITEIGPGLGALTDYLRPLAFDYCVMEKDQRFKQALSEYSPPLQILWGDTLEQKWDVCPKGMLVGNLPYNISPPILLKWLRYREHFPDAFFMIQKELGKRVMATPCTKAYGRISVMIQSVAYVELVAEVGPECFTPPPKVRSYMLHFRNNLHCVNLDLLEIILRNCFSQRRKILKNALEHFKKSFPSGYLESGLLSVGACMQNRPEELTVEQYIKFSEYIQKANL